jgi:MarR family transcriptional regulator, 2-MHQ and catechol-resistance regulon repressor
MPTHYSGNKISTTSLNTFIYFTRAANSLEGRLFSQDLLQGLTQSQFGVLEMLYHLGSLCQGELSHKLIRSTGNMTLILDNLEKQKLVERERDELDRRQVHIHLTPKGKEQIETVFPKVVKRIEREFSILSLEEQIELGKLCKILGKKERE